MCIFSHREISLVTFLDLPIKIVLFPILAARKNEEKEKQYEKALWKQDNLSQEFHEKLQFYIFRVILLESL